MDDVLEKRIGQAARSLGISQSELIRRAVARTCDDNLGATLAERLAPAIGCVRSTGGRARRSGRAFKRALRRKRR